ncbi:hypothetical protein ACFZB9_08240 [Kitasatospora sp. NPDC008050]|uniref:hypothetical protein n=1 Tax=Kitasatospora sp. NPDC008050 TaxID=3364021 RepID=UPI0036EE6631
MQASRGGGTGAGAASRWEAGDVVVVGYVVDVVEGRYEVLRVHEQGGMGLVHRVRHRGWGIDLAVKSPRPELLRDDRARERSVAQAECTGEREGRL